MADIPELINILRDARAFLQREDSDYAWSSWKDEQTAVAEIDEIIEGLMWGGSPPEVLHVIFAPTGPMQEVSLSSGWAQEFLDLASRFDRAMAVKSCACLETHSDRLVNEGYIGEDKRYRDVSLLKCPDCGQLWLRILYENEAFTESGRWFECPISASEREALTANTALDLMGSKNWFFVGGSYFGGVISKSRPPINLL